MARTRTRALRYSWPKDHPEEVSFKVGKLAKDFENFAPALLPATRILQEDIELRFETGTDPHGRPWKDWTELYRKDAEGHNEVVFPDRASLQREGKMRDDLDDPSQWTVTRNEVFLNTSGFDEKWAWHNYGLKNRTTKHGTPNPLKQREFLGTTEAADARIVAIFGAWIEGKVVEATSTKGTPFFRHAERGGAGRFVTRTY